MAYGSDKYPGKSMSTETYSKPMSKRKSSGGGSTKIKLGGLTEHSSNGKSGFSEKAEYNTRGVLAKK